MKTTPTLDDNILAMAKSLAEQRQKSIGEVISRLTRQALQRELPAAAVRNGVPLLPVRRDAGPVTLELVNRLRDESPCDPATAGWSRTRQP